MGMLPVGRQQLRVLFAYPVDPLPGRVQPRCLRCQTRAERGDRRIRLVRHQVFMPLLLGIPKPRRRSHRPWRVDLHFHALNPLLNHPLPAAFPPAASVNPGEKPRGGIEVFAHAVCLFACP